MRINIIPRTHSQWQLVVFREFHVQCIQQWQYYVFALELPKFWKTMSSHCRS
jgi:hypothetical protein